MCQRLWTEDEVSHHGEFFSFDGVVFEPKPVQQPWPPILIGGESTAALRRGATLGNGWIGMGHDFESGARQVEQLRTLLTDAGRDPHDFEYCLGGPVDSERDIARWEEIGVTRLIVSPWARSREAAAGLERFAELAGLHA